LAVAGGVNDCNRLFAASDDHHSRVVLIRSMLLSCHHCHRKYRRAPTAMVFSVLKKSSLHPFIALTAMNFCYRNFLNGTNGYGWQRALSLEL
jgi:hypothetical protein